MNEYACIQTVNLKFQPIGNSNLISFSHVLAKMHFHVDEHNTETALFKFQSLIVDAVGKATDELVFQFRTSKPCKWNGNPYAVSHKNIHSIYHRPL